jgi:hypothetical protein
MASAFIKGHGRRSLIANVAASVPGSTGISFGVFDVTQYSRFTGLISCIGSVTVRYQLGINSGAYQVTSSFVANSGGSSFDVLNPGGRFADISISAANSQVLAFGFIGEPLR